MGVVELKGFGTCEVLWDVLRVLGMIQTRVLDPSKRCTAEYAPPNHTAGEQWPGPERRPTRQLTLFGTCVVENARANTREAVTGVTGVTGVTAKADDTSDDEGWFFVKVPHPS